MMKKLLALLLTLMLVVQCVPVSARADSSLRPEIEKYGSVDAAMDAYAIRTLRPYNSLLRSMTTDGVLAFRNSVDEVLGRENHTSDPSALKEEIVNIGFTVTENDNRWMIKENQVELNLKYLLLLAQMEGMPFQHAVKRVEEYMPEYNLGAAAFNVAMDAFVNWFGGYMADMMKWDALAFAPSLAKASKTMKEGGVASRTLFKAMDGVVLNYDRIFSGANAMTDAAKALSIYTSQDAALTNLVNMYTQVLTGRSLVNTIRDAGITDEEMRTACAILSGAYEAYLEELNTMGQKGPINKELREKEYLNERFNAALTNALNAYSAGMDRVTAVVAGAAMILDIGMMGGWGTVVFKGGTNVLGELALGTVSTFTHFHAMMTLDEIYAALELDATSYPMETWADHVAYAKGIQRLCNVALLGETHIYQMVVEDAGVGQKIWNMLKYTFTGENDMQAYEQWYKQRTDYLKSVYNAAQEYMDALYEHYDRLNLQLTDVTELLGYEDGLTARITGVVVQDEWYALPDGSGPDKERPNPDAGKPVADLPIQLMAGDEPIAYGSTDGSGRYSITYLLSRAQNRTLTLTMGDETTRDFLVKEDVSTINYANTVFRSSFRFNADTESLTELSPAEASFKLPYADDYFLASSYEYNHNLALASIGLAAASMSDPDADASWTSDVASGRAGNIHAAWSAIGYQVVHTGGYDTSLNEISDTPAYTIASRTFTDSDARNKEPKKYRVVGVAIRGDVDAPELAHSLMAAGKDSDYQGSTRTAAMAILQELERYILAVADEEVVLKVWVTGFSRGGAIAGQLCDLIQLRPTLADKVREVYGYTFGATGSSTGDYSIRTDASGVYNIVYQEDLIANGLVPALQSGYSRPAHTYSFGKEDAGSSRRLIASAFGMLTDGNTSYDPEAYTAGEQTQEYLAAIRETSGSGIYNEELQPLVTAILQLAFLRDDAGSDFRTLSLADKHRQVLNMLGYSETVAGPIEFDGSFLPQLTLERYRAGMLEGAPETFFAALPEDVQNNLYTYIDDILQLAARQTGAASFTLDEDVQTFLLSLALTLSDDFGNPTCLASSLYGHHPEIYMAWLLSMKGTELFGQKDPDVFNTRILPVEMNLKGVVLEEGTEKPIAGVFVKAVSDSGDVYTITTDEKGAWSLFVKPDGVTVTFTLAGYEDAKERVSKDEFAQGVVERITYMTPKPAGTVIVTTESYVVEGEHYQADVIKPIVWSEINPDLTAAVDAVIAPIFEEGMRDAAEMIRDAAGCRQKVRDHTTHAYMSMAYATDGMVQLMIQHGYFVCTVGHNVNTARGYAFDIATGKLLTLDDLYDPENPNAKEQFLAVMDDLIARTEGISASASKVYNRVNKHSYCTWYFLPEGIYMTFNALETGWFDSLLIPFDRLEGILRKDYMPSGALGYGVVSPLTGPAPAEDEDYTLQINTPDDDTALCLDGLVSHMWVNNMASSSEYSSRCRYFYAYNLKDAKVWLPESDEMLYVYWRDSQGYHNIILNVNDGD